MSDVNQALPERVWRVGYHADPLAFVSFERMLYSHRFDDPYQRFRSLFVRTSSPTPRL